MHFAFIWLLCWFSLRAASKDYIHSFPLFQSPCIASGRNEGSNICSMLSFPCSASFSSDGMHRLFYSSYGMHSFPLFQSPMKGQVEVEEKIAATRREGLFLFLHAHQADSAWEWIMVSFGHNSLFITASRHDQLSDFCIHLSSELLLHNSFEVAI